MTRQLVGESVLSAAPFHYCGSIGPLSLEEELRQNLERLGSVLVESCGLRGLFGVDGLLRDGTFWPVEINPRYVASVEVLEYATGWPTLAWHADVFTRGQPPSQSVSPPRDSVIGKAILFARADFLFPDDGPWMAEVRKPTPLDQLPSFADIPSAGQAIRAGQPILTFFTQGASPSACANELRRKAAAIERWLFR
jgi:predicted ATP-grasp superfamily ATP-dependent carboligase